MEEVLRREEKFLLKQSESYHMAHRLGALMARDTFAENGAYRVRSLYFDTVNDRDFFDKIDEQEIRQKIRLRLYDPMDETVKLERKQKQNIYQRKQTLMISRADAQQMAQGKYHVLLNYQTEFADELYGILTRDLYRPKTIVEYRRDAFVARENHIRLTLDSDIRGCESNMDLFAPMLPLLPVFDPAHVVMEVKYDKFLLSYIKDILQDVDKTQVSASKYCTGRSVSLPLWL